MISLPQGTEMFQFPRFPRRGYLIHRAVTGYHPRRVAPFGLPWIIARPQLPKAFRRVATSFFGPRRQGIHRVPLLQFFVLCSTYP